MQVLREQDPRQIGPYRLLGRLGSGGMGEVFLARSPGGRTVAVKVVREELAAKDAFRLRFRREVEAARSVGGDWTARVLDADTEAGSPWIATAFVPGPGLDTVVEEEHGPLPERTVLVMAGRLAQALTAIHAAGLVHRDLKPSNVLLTLDGPRVIDFGIARHLALGTQLTQTGYAVGSPGFMSPEQVRGETVGTASDVFGLGALLAYAATGRRPFGSSEIGPHAQMFRIVSEEPDLAGVEGELLALITGCLHKVPQERLPLPEIVARTTAGAPAGGGGGAAGAGGGVGGGGGGPPGAPRPLDTEAPEEARGAPTEAPKEARSAATETPKEAGSTTAEPAPAPRPAGPADQGTYALRAGSPGTPEASSTPPTRAEETPVPPHTRAQTLPKRRRRLAFPLVAAVVIALTAGGFVFVPSLLDDRGGTEGSGDHRGASSSDAGQGAGPGEKSSKSPEPSKSSQSPQGKDSPTKNATAGKGDKSGKPSADASPSSEDTGGDSGGTGPGDGFPGNYAGEWQNLEAGLEWNFTIPSAPAGKSVTWGVSGGDGSYCTFEAPVEEATADRLVLGKSVRTGDLDNGDLASVPCEAGDRPYFDAVDADQLTFHGTGQDGMYAERAA
ncbi:serine/threonine-protein kinase [Streptomyces sp. N35]|uniref:serine/threonine-protein kinase n=1 Tax=Streptomyces sp. N35 TaxID=2795730 RepID=UPI0018F6BC6D|nr:serine/threonine-protein kinase [Streptomyces sp. N35]